MINIHNGDDWKLLVVEDDPEQAYAMMRLLARRLQASIDTVTDLASARAALAGQAYDAVVTDYQLPDGSGLDLLREVSLRPEHLPVILVTGQGDEGVAAEAFRLQASGYVVKDSKLPEMVSQVVSRALGEISLRRAEEALLAGERNQRALLDATPETLLLVDMEGRILTINQTGASRLGGTPEEMAGSKLVDYLDPELAAGRREQFARAARTAAPLRFEDEQDGMVLDNVLYPVLDKDGKVERIAAFSRDVTRARANEEALKKAHAELEDRVLERTAQLREANAELAQEVEERARAEETLRALSDRVQEQARVLDQILSSGPQHFYLFDEKGKFIYASRPAAELLGRDQSEFAGKYWWDLGFPRDVMSVLDVERENVRRTGRTWTGGMKFPTVRGIREFEYVLSPVFKADGGVEAVVASARDVTEENATRRELAERTASLQARARLLDLTHETILVRDANGRIALWNAGAEEMWGWSSREAAGRDRFELLKTEFELPFGELEELLLQDGRWEGELVQTAKDGARRTVASRQVLQWSDDRRTYSVLEVQLDVSDRRALQDELEREVARLEHRQRVLALLPVPVYVMDADGAITFWNAAAERVFGWTADEATGKDASGLLRTEYPVSPEDARETLLRDGTWEGDLIHVTRTGTRVTGPAVRSLELDESGAPASVTEIFHRRTREGAA